MSTAVFNKIAKEVGVSPRTVRRILNGELRDSRPSIVARSKRIQEMAAKLSYRPNAAAKAVASGRFNTIGMLNSVVRKLSALGDYLHGLQEACRSQNLHLMIGDLPDEQLSSEVFVPKLLREWSVDGLIVGYTHNYPQQMLTLIRRYRIPSVWLNAKLDTDCVYPDDFGGGYEAVRRLLELGHRRIAFLGQMPFGWSTHFSCVDRFDGAAAACREAGLEIVDWRFDDEQTSDSGYRQICDLLRSPDRPTGVVTYGGGHAVLLAATAVGLAVPRDLSILTFKGSLADEAGPVVGTMLIPVDQVATEAVEMLVRKLDQPGTSVAPVAVPLRRNDGDTVGPASERRQ